MTLIGNGQRLNSRVKIKIEHNVSQIIRKAFHIIANYCRTNTALTTLFACGARLRNNLSDELRSQFKRPIFKTPLTPTLRMAEDSYVN